MSNKTNSIFWTHDCYRIYQNVKISSARLTAWYLTTLLVTNQFRCFSRWVKYIQQVLESCAGWKFLSAPAPHPQEFEKSCGTRRLLTRARTTLFPSQTCTCHCVSENHWKLVECVSSLVAIYSVVHLKAYGMFW